MNKLIGILIMLVVYTTTVIGQTDETINILFLGNSYTYYNGVPSIVSDMGLQKGKKNCSNSNYKRGKFIRHLRQH